MALLTNHSRHILPFAALLAFLAALGQEVVTFDGYYPYGAASVQPLKFGGKELERRGGHKSFIMMEIRWIVFRLLILKYQSALVVIHRMRLKKLLMSIHKER